VIFRQPSRRRPNVGHSPASGLCLWQHRTVPKDSSNQADQIRAWLKRAGFKQGKSELDQSEQWLGKDCDVRLTPEGNDSRVQIWHRQTTTGWRDLDEVVHSRATWPEAATIPPLELATTPLSPGHKQRDLWRHAPRTWLYRSKPARPHSTPADGRPPSRPPGRSGIARRPRCGRRQRGPGIRCARRVRRRGSAR